jgi:hypothetical protein
MKELNKQMRYKDRMERIRGRTDGLGEWQEGIVQCPWIDGTNLYIFVPM